MSNIDYNVVAELVSDMRASWSGGYGYALHHLDRERWRSVDPFPAYGHDLTLVRNELERIMEFFPVGVFVDVHVLPKDGESHTNGNTEIIRSQNGWSAMIVLHGKRIPIHPAVTRYIVAHEYGHVVEEFLGRKDNDFLLKYAQLRKLSPGEYVRYGEGGVWHKSIAEVFANDFRILVAGREADFWQHPFERPETVEAIVEFWDKAWHSTRKAEAI